MTEVGQDLILATTIKIAHCKFMNCIISTDVEHFLKVTIPAAGGSDNFGKVIIVERHYQFRFSIAVEITCRDGSNLFAVRAAAFERSLTIIDEGAANITRVALANELNAGEQGIGKCNSVISNDVA